jgi:hypothetical protein
MYQTTSSLHRGISRRIRRRFVVDLETDVTFDCVRLDSVVHPGAAQPGSR